MRASLLPLLVYVPSLLAMVACKPNVAWRDHDPHSLHVLGSRQDRLSGPYAAGSTLNLWITAGRKLDGFSVHSSDTDVFTVATAGLDAEGYLQVVGVASGEGIATLELQNPRGRTIDSLDLEVRTPDRFRLIPNALARIGTDADEAAVDEVRMLEHTEVALAVEITADGTRLAGDAGLSVELPEIADSLGRVLELADGADLPPFLKLTSTQPRSLTAKLVHAGAGVLEVPVEVVPAEAITTLAIEGTEAGVAVDDAVYLHAAARDAEGRRILGVDADWHVELGAATSGDLYTYALDPSDPNELTAIVGELTATRTIAGKGNATSSTSTGCSTHEGGSSPRAMLLGLLARR